MEGGKRNHESHLEQLEGAAASKLLRKGLTTAPGREQRKSAKEYDFVEAASGHGSPHSFSDLVPRAKHRSLAIALDHAVKGSVTAYTAIIALNTLTALITRRKFQLGLKTRWGSFLAAFVGCFRGVETFTRIQGQSNPSLAAGVSALVSIWILEPSTRGTIIAYSFVRAVLTSWQDLKQRNLLPDVWKPAVIMNMVAGARLPYAWMFLPETFEVSHLRSLDKYSALKPKTLSAIREGLKDGSLYYVCDHTHPGKHCIEHAALEMFPALLRGAAKTFVPIYAMSLISSVLAILYGGGVREVRKADADRGVSTAQRHHIKSEQKSRHNASPISPNKVVAVLHLLKRSSKNYLGSCLFLALFYQVPMLFCCLYPSKDKGRTLSTAVKLGGALGGLAILLEPPKRRALVASMTNLYIILTFVNEWAGKNKIPKALAEGPGKLAFQAITFLSSMVLIMRRPDLQPGMFVKLLSGRESRAFSKRVQTNEHHEQQTASV